MCKHQGQARIERKTFVDRRERAAKVKRETQSHKGKEAFLYFHCRVPRGSGIFLSFARRILHNPRYRAGPEGNERACSDDRMSHQLSRRRRRDKEKGLTDTACRENQSLEAKHCPSIVCVCRSPLLRHGTFRVWRDPDGHGPHSQQPGGLSAHRRSRSQRSSWRRRRR